MTDTERRDVEQTLRINATPETVWRYWTDPERMCVWWGAAAELDPRPGGACRVAMGGGPVMQGEFVELVPYERIVFSFGWEATEGASDVPATWADEHQKGWAHFLPILATAAADQK